jgi:sugar phosphate isomerase/epimerase
MTELSFQLYSARNVPSLPDFLATLGQLGYTQVEGFGGLYADAQGLADNLKKNGLSMPTGHFGPAQAEDVSTTLKTAETLGIKKIIVPHIGPEGRSTDESKWLELAEFLAKHAEIYTKEGYAFGWHNHDFEFATLDDGSTPQEQILAGGPDLEWEADIAWIIRGNADPLAWIESYGKRITAVHVKDIAPAGENKDEDGWADVGHGVLDWPALAKAIKADTSAQYYVMEHDNPRDVDRFAQRSLATVKSWT